MDDLSFYDVENAVVVTTLDLGTIAPHSSDDTLLRVANNSTAYQAEDVTVAATSIQLWLSVDGDNYTASIDLGDIPPNGTSSPFWLRRVTPAGTGAQTGSLTATPASWSDPIDTSTSGNISLTEI